MSLKSNWQEAPKVITTGRTVRYAAEPTAWADSEGNTVNLYWTVRRVSSMAFEILALTQSAAEEGAAALQREYTRKYARWTADTDNAVSPPSVRVLKSNALLCTSSITPRLVEGSIWHIEATIDEEDTIIADHEPTYDEFEELFALAFAREEADDGQPAIVITEAHWDSINGEITALYDVANIDSFDTSLVVVQRKQGDNWVAVSNVTAGAGGVSFPYAQNLAFRVSYASGLVISNVYTTTDEPMPSLSILGSEYTYSPSAVSDAGLLTLSVDIQATGVARALASLTIRNRWTIRANGVPVNNSYTAISQVSTGVYNVRFAVGYAYSAPPDLAVQLVFNSVDESTLSVAVSTTFTPANYVGEQWCKVVSTQPDAVRAMAYLETDLTAADLSAAFKAEQLYTALSGQVVVGATYNATNVQLVELAASQPTRRKFYIYGDFPIPYQGTMYSLAFSASLGGVKSNRLTVQFFTSPLYISAADADGLTFAFEGPGSFVVDSAVQVYAYGDGTGADSAAEVAVASRSGKTITFAAQQPDTRLRVYGCNDPGGISVHKYTSPWVCNSADTPYFQLVEATKTDRPDGSGVAVNPLFVVFDRVIPDGLTVTSVEWLASLDGENWYTLTTQPFEDGIAVVPLAFDAPQFAYVRAVFTLSNSTSVTTNAVQLS